MSIFNYKIELLENGVWSPLRFWVRPYHDTTSLDESLDSGNFKLSCVLRNKIIKPFTPLRFTIKEYADKAAENAGVPIIAERVFYRLVSDVQKVKRTFQTDIPRRYDHIITTIEYTKLLERSICDTLTFTNYLGHDYMANAVLLDPTPIHKRKYNASDEINDIDINHLIEINSVQVPKKMSMKPVGATITLPALTSFVTKPVYGLGGTSSWVEAESGLSITHPDGTIVSYNKDTGVTIDNTIEGSYYIAYKARIYLDQYPSPNYYIESIWEYSIGIVENIDPKTPWNIRSVVERILSVGVTRREGVDPQKYILDSSIADKLENIPAPEFHIARCTLFEALMQVGGYIHAIPRLEYPTEAQLADGIEGVLTFDFLGGNTVRTLPSNIALVENYNVDEYSGALDSTVENLVNTLDSDSGSVVEPFSNGYISVRTDEGKVEISNDTAIILLNSPIYRLTRLIIRINGVDKDITQYVYEAAEYSTLSSYSGSAFPYSKAYALTYTQGDNKITGLAYKVEATGLGEFWNDPVLKNIIKREFGGEVPSYIDLRFKAEYIPIVSGRVVQKKTSLDFPLENTLLYNQGAGTVESTFYGEMLKGAMARLGNSVWTITCDFNNLDSVPKVGEVVHLPMVDGYVHKLYVALVSCEYERRYIRGTLTLTPNFNKLSEYLGLNSNFRLFDISERQSVERFVNYGECVVIGNSVDVGVHNRPMVTGAMEAFRSTFIQDTESKPVSFAILKAMSGYTVHSEVLLPCTAVAMGNSLAFMVRYKDNYGAGYQSNALPDNNRRVQHLFPYGDVYGEFEKLGISLDNEIVPSSLNAHKLPDVAGDIVYGESDLFNTLDNSLLVKKDSRESLNITIQQHFVTNRRSIVIGSLLARNNALIKKSAPKPKSVLLTHEINMLNSKVDLATSKDISDKTTISNIENNYKFWIDFDRWLIDTTGYKAWAMVDPITGEYYIAENLEDGELKGVNFTFVDNTVLRRLKNAN